jgi:mediator of RNA polymerase II transcription subunit 31
MSCNDQVIELSEEEERQRFLMELEFVQSLANPHYLQHLAQSRYFEEQCFLDYLRYLEYFRDPKYAQFILYPHCLHFLSLLQEPSFRAALLHESALSFLHNQQLYQWRYSGTRSTRSGEST